MPPVLDTSGGLYTVKQAAALTGVLETTLRVWERRYGLVTPVRSSGGYRLYDDEQLARLRRMASLVADGVPASVAARSLTASEGPTDEPAVAGSDADTPDLVAAARALDPALLDETLGRGLAGPSLGRAVDAWLMPELKRVGEEWASGRLSVAHEHFVTAGVQRTLGALLAGTPDAASERPVLVGLPSGSRHELGLLAFAACLRHLGVAVVYLGADVPADDWAAAASTLLPRAAVVGVPLGTRTLGAQAVADRLARLSPPIAVWAGGGLARRVRGARTLPPSIEASASEVAESLRAGRV